PRHAAADTGPPARPPGPPRGPRLRAAARVRERPFPGADDAGARDGGGGRLARGPVLPPRADVRVRDAAVRLREAESGRLPRARAGLPGVRVPRAARSRWRVAGMGRPAC